MCIKVGVLWCNLSNYMDMKKFILSFMALLAVGSTAIAQEQDDYYVKHGADVSVTHKDHYPKMVGVANVRGEEQKLYSHN